MRRQSKSKYPVFKVKPLITWCKCIKCGMEFRREEGWKFYLNDNPRTAKYICTGCADTEEKAFVIKKLAEGMRPYRPVGFVSSSPTSSQAQLPAASAGTPKET